MIALEMYPLLIYRFCRQPAGIHSGHTLRLDLRLGKCACTYILVSLCNCILEFPFSSHLLMILSSAGFPVVAGPLLFNESQGSPR